MPEAELGRADAEVFVAQLNSGALPVEMEVVGQTRIGPTLGREAVDAAVEALPEALGRRTGRCLTKGTPLVGLAPRDLEARLQGAHGLEPAVHGLEPPLDRHEPPLNPAEGRVGGALLQGQFRQEGHAVRADQVGDIHHGYRGITVRWVGKEQQGRAVPPVKAAPI